MSAEIVLPDGFKIEQLMEIRSKLVKVYDDWIENFKEKNLEKAKEFTVYYGRDISMNFVTTKFRLTAQADGAESKNLTFLEVRRILNWMLHGNDPFKKWSSVKDTDLKESLMDSVIEKTKKMLIENDYPENLNVTFAVEDAEEKGNYTVRIFKPKTSGSDAPRATGGGGGGKSKTEKVKTEKVKTFGAPAPKKTGKPSDSGSRSKTSIPDADVLDVLITAVEAIAELKKINLASQGQKTALAMKLSSAMESIFESI
jgi:hypothetical protein